MTQKGLLASAQQADRFIEQIKPNYNVNGVLVIPVDGDLRDALAEAFCVCREDALNERAEEITQMIERAVSDDDDVAL